MIRFLLTQVLIWHVAVSSAQQQTIDLKQIKRWSDTDVYDKLFARFIANDTTLKPEDYTVIYYGQAFRSTYRPYARHDSIPKLNTYLNQHPDAIDFHRVLSYTRLILKNFPFSIDAIFFTAVAYDKLGVADSSAIWFYKYDNLIRTIIRSGDGRTPESAMIVASVADEYAILFALGLQVRKQSLLWKNKKPYDMLEVAENPYGVDKLYFDISLFFGKM